jgi:UDP:flavonoid glycosyltransferase YjiC (YdhE family)
MRVLFACLPAYGHFHPLGPLARALIERGHEVAFATGADYCERVRRFGFTALPAGATEAEMGAIASSIVTEAMQHGPENMPLHVFPNLFGRALTPRMLPDLLAHIRAWKPALIIHEPTTLAAPLAAAMTGVPSINHSWGARTPLAAHERAADLVSPLWREHGLTPPPLCGVYRGAYIDVCPPSLQSDDVPEAKTRYRMRPVPFDQSENESLPAWVATLPKRPTVYVTLGTVFTALPTFQIVLAALRNEAVNLVMTIGPRGDPAVFGAQPENVHIERYIPQTLLLPHCQAVISHGGSGTMLATLAHGLAMLALPQGADQFMNAERLRSCGAGRLLMPPQVDEESVRREVRALLSDTALINRAAALRDEIGSMATPAEIAAKLEATL